MTVIALPGNGFFVPEISAIPEAGFLPQLNDTVLDAANEEIIFTGRIALPARTGTKTLSAGGGGSISWMSGAATIVFANAGTTLRVGVQDTDAANGPAGRGDGTDDVYGEMVGGTDTIAAATLITTDMGSGTKDITHGQLISISLRLTSRAGSDLVRVRAAGATAAGTAIPSHMPNVVSNLGAYLPVNAVPICFITFDDGTYGFFEGGWVTSTGALNTTLSYNSGSTPDEYANIITLPYPVELSTLWATVNLVTADSDLELVLYADPLGTPSAVEAVVIDGNTVAFTNSVRRVIVPLTAVRSFAANAPFAVAIRPTSANNVSAYEFDVPDEDLFHGHSLGPECYRGTRTNQSGAFSPTTTKRLFCGARISGLDNGAGGGGSTGISRARAGSGMGS